MCLPKTVLVLSIRKKEVSKMRQVEIPDDGIVSEYIWAVYSVAGIRRFDLSYLPTIEAEPVRHGRWVERPNTKGQVYCSECGTLEKTTDNNFKSMHCPHCGAKMDGEA